MMGADEARKGCLEKTLLTRKDPNMIKVSIFYPRKEGGRFDRDYYLETHMPMSIERLGVHPGFKGVSVEHGLDGVAPGTDATYVAMCHFLFDRVEDFMAAFTPHASVLQGDMPNYTNIEPVIQFSEVMILR